MSLIIQPKADIPLINPNGSKQNLDISLRYNFSEAKDAEGFSIAASGTHEYRVNKTLKEQKKVNIQIKSEEALGTFSPAGEKECVVGYTLDLQFKLNKKSYYLIGFEAVSANDSSESRASSVSFGEIERDDENGIYKIHVRVIEEANDILIQPVCLELPAVKSYTPSAGTTNNANMPIVLTFNMPMEDSLADWKNISLSVNGKSITQYFEKPAFDETKTRLTLQPVCNREEGKIKTFQQYIENLKTTYVDVDVMLKSNISVTKTVNEKPVVFSLKNDSNTNFSVGYSSEMETTPPQVFDWFITAQEIKSDVNSSDESIQKFTVKKVSDTGFTTADVLTNLSNGIVYIYIDCADADSGVKSVTVHQLYTNNNCGETELTNVGETEKTSVYGADSEDAEFLTDKSGKAVILIKHKIFDEINPFYGAVSLQVSVKDTCENKAELPELSVITYGVINYYDPNYSLPLKSKSELEPTSLVLDFTRGYYDLQVYGNEDLSRRPIDDANVSYYCIGKDKNGTEHCVKFETSGTNLLEAVLPIGEIKKVHESDTNIVTGISGKEFKIVVKYKFAGKEYTIAEQNFKFPTGMAIFDTTKPEQVKTRADIAGARIKKYDKTTQTFMDNNPRDDSSWIEALSDDYELYFIPEMQTNRRSNYQYPYYIYGEPLGPYTLSNTNISQLPEKLNVKVIDYKKSLKEGYADVIFDFGEDISERFTSVFIMYSTPYPYATNNSNCCREHYYSGQIITIPLPVVGLEKVKVSIQGMGKNGLSTDETLVTVSIPKDRKAEFDNISPKYCDEHRTDSELEIIFQDKESGPASGTATVHGKTFYFVPTDEEDKFSVKIPIAALWDYVKNTVEYEFYDQAGNKNTFSNWYPISYQSSIVKSASRSGSTWTPTIWVNDGLGRFDDSYLKFFTYSDGSASWSVAKTLTKADTEYAGSAYGYKLKAGTNLTISTTSKFVKAAAYYGCEVNAAYYAHEIHYTDSYSGNGNYNNLGFNAGQKSSMWVQSDAPALVHTISTTKSYEECSTWNASQWECLNRESGVKVFTFTSALPVPQHYDIPVNEVNDGEYYVVIAHYADGSTAMSEIMKK